MLINQTKYMIHLTDKVTIGKIGNKISAISEVSLIILKYNHGLFLFIYFSNIIMNEILSFIDSLFLCVYVLFYILELPYGWEKIDDPHYGTYYIE